MSLGQFNVLLAILLVSGQALADITIFDVRKNLPLSDTDKVYRDFYINAGSEAGLANGMVITVQRKLPLYDNYQNRSAGDLELKVARVKIIHVQKGLAVARLHTEFGRENSPLLEDNFIMLGDRLDLATAVMEKGGKQASESQPTEEPKAEASPPPTTDTAALTQGQIIVNSVEISPHPVPVTISQ